MTYKCINGFQRHNGEKFHYGEVITSYRFTSLNQAEQGNFKKEDEEPSYFSSSSDTSSDNSSSYSFDLGSSFISDTSSDSSSSYDNSSSNTDFGGGDFDGGGAGSDW